MRCSFDPELKRWLERKIIKRVEESPVVQSLESRKCRCNQNLVSRSPKDEAVSSHSGMGWRGQRCFINLLPSRIISLRGKMISLFVLISWNLFPPQILKQCSIRCVGYLIPLFQRTRLVGDAGALHSAALELCGKLRKAIDLARGRSWGEGKSMCVSPDLGDI